MEFPYLVPNRAVTDSFLFAISIAERAHRGQLDKADDPYFWHVLRVGSSLLPDLDAAVVGLFHDIVEDCDRRWRLEVCRFLGGNLYAEVLTLSRVEGETYEDYIQRVISGGPLARKVKWADLKDNLDLARLARAAAQGADILPLLEKYNRALRLLAEAELPASKNPILTPDQEKA